MNNKEIEKKQTHREPTLYIVGNKERADEIRHILEDEFGGKHRGYTCGNSNNAYFVDSFGFISSCSLDNYYFKEAITNGRMKEYELPEKQRFKPFDRVVVRDFGCCWTASYFSHFEKGFTHPFNCCGMLYKQCLPYNDETSKLIGTRDEWKGGEE